MIVEDQSPAVRQTPTIFPYAHYDAEGLGRILSIGADKLPVLRNSGEMMAKQLKRDAMRAAWLEHQHRQATNQLQRNRPGPTRGQAKLSKHKARHYIKPGSTVV